MEQIDASYIDIIIPQLKSLTAQSQYTYQIDRQHQGLKPGSIVTVPFGKKTHLGVVSNIDRPAPTNFEARSITEHLPDFLLSKSSLKLAQQISEYFFCTPHQALQLFLPNYVSKTLKQPKKFKPSSFIANLEQQPTTNHQLTAEQTAIIDAIQTNKTSTHLIIGPTGSGKTEVYKQLAQKLTPDQQALILVPEISITPQLGQYFYNQFGEQIAIWHSDLNNTEKKHVWWGIKTGQIRIVVGSRSASFLPWQDLALICMDEEQEDSYKQDRTPRYHTRTIGQWLSKEHNCPLVLGSATPSLETYHAAITNRIQLHRLTKRVSGHQPKIEIVDMREETKKGNFGIFSDELLSALETTYKASKQSLLFLNRRGFAHSLQCLECGHTETCSRCDSTLTIHKPKTRRHYLQCHTCSSYYQIKEACPSCGGLRLKEIGLGTQQIVSELTKLLPQARILRADRDTTGKKHAFSEIYNDFKNGEADILIGTQMIAKGLHLPNVELVGVILADVGLHIPDFRAQERVFQQLVQVAGRAGRAGENSRVIIQTLSPENIVLQSLDHNNIDEFYSRELLVRKEHKFPPFVKLTKLTYVDRDAEKCLMEAKRIEQILCSTSYTVLGAPALIFKQFNQFHYNILLFNNQPETVISQLNLNPAWRIDRDPVGTAF